MTLFLAHLVVTAALLLLVANLVPGVQVQGFGSAFLGALALGLVNAFVRPLMVLLTLPLTILTFGLFLLVINALMIQLASSMLEGFSVSGFWPAFFGAIVLSLLNTILRSLVLGD